MAIRAVKVICDASSVKFDDRGGSELYFDIDNVDGDQRKEFALYLLSTLSEKDRCIETGFSAGSEIKSFQ